MVEIVSNTKDKNTSFNLNSTVTDKTRSKSRKEMKEKSTKSQ